MPRDKIVPSKSPLSHRALPALKRSAQRARQEALRHNTDLIIWQDNKLCRITPRQIKEESGQYSVKPEM